MKRHYSTIDVSAICGVDPVTVARWCDKGDLPCYRTPGGHRRIGREDAQHFAALHVVEGFLGAQDRQRAVQPPRINLPIKMNNRLHYGTLTRKR